MKNCGDYDEKQLIDRGIAFRYGFIAAMVMMLLAYFAVDVLELQITDRRLIFNVCFWVPEMVCAITMIVKDAYDGLNSDSGRTMMIFFAIVGGILIVSPLWLMFSRLETRGMQAFWEELPPLFTGVCVTAQSLVYWWRQRANRKKFED